MFAQYTLKFLYLGINLIEDLEALFSTFKSVFPLALRESHHDNKYIYLRNLRVQIKIKNLFS